MRTIMPHCAKGMQAKNRDARERQMAEPTRKQQGLVSSIQSYSLHDGPGCRTTVFLAGCFLRCTWCANPETWELKQQVMYAPGKCVRAKGCAGCLKKCAHDGVSPETESIRLDWEKCRTCAEFACAEACPTEALRKCGEWYRVEEVMQRLERERDFWGPGGGVTFSGGEPFFQGWFLQELLAACKRKNLHTAIETTAHAAPEAFLAAMSLIDFAFIDVKHMDDKRHQAGTGVSNKLILSNIAKLRRSGWNGRLVLRIPVISGFNDTLENMRATADFMDSLGLYEINLLPFHRLGDSKWEQLGKTYAHRREAATSPQVLEELQKIFLQRKIACYVGSQTAF